MIFADTSFLVALTLRRDDYHEAANQLLRSAQRQALVLTNHILGESWTHIRRRLDHVRAVHFLDRIASTKRISVSRVDSSLEEEAWSWLRHHDEREYSFVDATSFAYMRRHGITEALAFDGDFAAAGFVELRP